MQLLLKEDMAERTKFSKNIPDKDFEVNRLLVQENEVTPFIGTACLNAILAFDRDSTTDQATELYSFWQNYVRPYAIYKVFQLFIDTHGIDFAPSGVLQSPTGENRPNPVTIQERSAVAKQYEKFASNALAKLKIEFADKNKTFDGVTYSLDDNSNNDSPKAVGMTAIGKVRDKITYIRTQRI